MKEIGINTEYITLGKFLKYVNAVDSGAVAKMVILDGLVLVNGEVDRSYVRVMLSLLKVLIML